MTHLHVGVAPSSRTSKPPVFTMDAVVKGEIEVVVLIEVNAVEIRRELNNAASTILEERCIFISVQF